MKGKGGSSSLPQKHNPVSCTIIQSIAIRMPPLISIMLSCMIQDYERASGNGHAEWETLANIVTLTAGVLYQSLILTNALEVDVEQMAKNIELTKGLIYAENIMLALTGKIGRSEAHKLIETFCRESRSLKIHLEDLLLISPVITNHISPNQIEILFDPVHSL